MAAEQDFERAQFKKVAKQMEGKEKGESCQLPKEVGLACKRLGLCYHESKGVKANKEEAIARIKKAASVGFKKPRQNLLNYSPIRNQIFAHLTNHR